MPAGKRGRKGKQGKQGKASVLASQQAAREEAAAASQRQVQEQQLLQEQQQAKQPPTPGLILTSDQRRGIYECDYCHADISQTPRIRCAVCDDFDLCCDCFATTDHVEVAQRLMAAQQMSASLKKHDPATHGYRVCDSCRYPLFPVKSKQQSSVVAAGKKKLETAEESFSADSTEKEKFDAMEVEYSNEANTGTEEKASGKAPATGTQKVSNTSEIPQETAAESVHIITLQGNDDPKTTWTVEEDLRLLRGIETHGLGNWSDIAESVAGPGSVGKTPKRCMERYFDDFMGRYGYILPPYTLMGEHTATENDGGTEGAGNSDKKNGGYDPTASPVAAAAAEAEGSQGGKSEDTASASTGEATRSSKRRSAMLRSPSTASSSGAPAKKFKALSTESVPDYQKLWPNPHLPTLDSGPVKLGQEVGRDQATKAEQAFVRAISAMDTAEQVEKIRKDWEMNRLNKPGGPTVLPMRPDDLPRLPGSELVGFMPRRGDFDVEWENNAEESIADMEFVAGESEQDRQLKLQVLAIYNSKLDEREKRKKFVLSRKLYDYRKHQQEYEKLPQDERDLVNRMRLFERFHTPAEHKLFIADLLKAKRLRKEIAKLQMYRRIGIRTVVEAERYELDKARRQFHKTVSIQKEAEAKKAQAAAQATAASGESKTGSVMVDDTESSYWKQYRPNDRKIRKSINRGPPPFTGSAASAANNSTTADSSSNPQASTSDMPASTKVGVSPESLAQNKSLTGGDADIPAGDNSTKQIAKPDDPLKDSNTDEPMEVEGQDDTPSKEDDFSKLPGFSRLSAREVELCQSVALQPNQYLEIKKALIHESLLQGLLDDKQSGKQKNSLSGKFAKKLTGSQRTLVKIDVQRRGQVIDFIVRAGWISTKFGQAVRESL